MHRGHRGAIQGGGCKLDLVVGELQGRVDAHGPASQLEAPGSDECGRCSAAEGVWSLCSMGGWPLRGAQGRVYRVPWGPRTHRCSHSCSLPLKFGNCRFRWVASIFLLCFSETGPRCVAPAGVRQWRHRRITAHRSLQLLAWAILLPPPQSGGTTGAPRASGRLTLNHSPGQLQRT